MDRFDAFRGNALIKKRKNQKLSDLENNVLTLYSMLQPIVKMRDEAQEMVFHVDTERFARACPTSLADGASPYAMHTRAIAIWDPRLDKFIHVTLAEWVATHHTTHTLMMIGKPGKGKSKLLMMLAWEMCASKPCDEFVFAKSIDPLGVLSHTGVLRRAGCLVLTDFDLKTKAGALTSEELKSLLDVIEGGSIPSTRYRACQLEGGLPRMIAVNTNGQGDEQNYGSWFQKFGQYGLAALVDNLNDLPAATQLIRTMPDDEVASARRVALWSLESYSLINHEMHSRLTQGTAAVAAERATNRKVYWEKRQST
jgi:hypothetical protein